MIRSRILGVGRYLPERRVTNSDLAGMFNTSDEWIRQRTGIVERHFADEGVYCSDLGLEASRTKLADLVDGAAADARRLGERCEPLVQIAKYIMERNT